MKMHTIITLLLFSLALSAPCSAQSRAKKTQRPAVMKIEQLEKRFRNSSDTTYVLNFWATWCVPCVQELPWFEQADSLHKNEKVKVLLISMDDLKTLDSKLMPFIKRKKLQSEVILLDESNADHFIPKIDERWGGAIPATVIINNATGYRWMYEGKLKSHEELEQKIQAAAK